MSSSPDLLTAPAERPVQQRTLVDTGTARVSTVHPRELRSGSWTRLGASTVLGDAVTEQTLAGLAEQAEAAARAQGYARGWSEGRRAAEQQAAEERTAVLAEERRSVERREAEHRAAVAALVAAAARLDEAVAHVCEQVESEALELAAQLTEAVVGHELAVAASPGLHAVRRALALTQGEALVRVRVSADDHSPELAERAGLDGTATVVADPTLMRGDAVVETVAGVVDARISSAVARVTELLRS
jgi:flagellar assembly protein FliH